MLLGSGISFAGSMTGVYCNYTATLSPGDNNPQSLSAMPPAQTGSPSTGMLTSFTGLQIANWQLQLKGTCIDGSKIKVTQAVIEGWVGVEGSSVTSRTLDDTSSVCDGLADDRRSRWRSSWCMHNILTLSLHRNSIILVLIGRPDGAWKPNSTTTPKCVTSTDNSHSSLTTALHSTIQVREKRV